MPKKRRVIPDGARCDSCGKVARGRCVLMIGDEPHPYPYRHFKCRNPSCFFLVEGPGNLERIADGMKPKARRWNVDIPETSLADA
jgi:hypothetical protein